MSRRNLHLLVLGNAVSTFGSSVYLIVVVLLLKDLTESGVLLGLYQFLALVPAALLMPLTGPLVDRLPRKGLIVAADLLRGGATLLLAAAWLSAPLQTPWIILLVALLLGVGNAIFVPAAQALIPELVDDQALEGANALRATTNQLSNLAGNAVGGVAYALVSAPLIFLLNGISFILSALEELAIKLPDQGREQPEHDTVLASALEGVRLVAGETKLRLGFLSQVALFAISPPVVLSLPFLVEDRLGEPEWLVGVLFASMLAGAILAFLGLSRFHRGSRSLLPRAYGILSVALLSVAVLPGLPTIFLASIVAGAAAGAVYIEVATTVQRRFPRSHHGRLFAVIEAGNAVIAPVAYLASGTLIDLIAPRVELLYLIPALPALLWAVRLAVASSQGRL
ncbi:MAG: MFS transporter [Alkalispirochaetaceae bacterium]